MHSGGVLFVERRWDYVQHRSLTSHRFSEAPWHHVAVLVTEETGVFHLEEIYVWSVFSRHETSTMHTVAAFECAIFGRDQLMTLAWSSQESPSLGWKWSDETDGGEPWRRAKRIPPSFTTTKAYAIALVMFEESQQSALGQRIQASSRTRTSKSDDTLYPLCIFCFHSHGKDLCDGLYPFSKSTMSATVSQTSILQTPDKCWVFHCCIDAIKQSELITLCFIVVASVTVRILHLRTVKDSTRVSSSINSYDSPLSGNRIQGPIHVGL